MFDCLSDANGHIAGAGLRKGPHTPCIAALMGATALMSVAFAGPASAQTPAQPRKPNIIMIVSDDTGYGDLGPYGGGEGRGMPTPNIDKLAAEGMTFFSFYAQPSCTPGRAAMQTGRIPNRSGMTTVAFQGQGGGLPAAEWTLASVLKTGGYKTFFTGKWHLGEADYAMPNAQGYDEMKYGGLYHLNAYTYADPTWFPDMDPELRAMFQRVTKGALSGNAGEPANEDFKINGQYVNTPRRRAWSAFPSSTTTSRRRRSTISTAMPSAPEPFFMSVNFMKVHQPNMPHPTTSTSRCRRASTPIRWSSSTPGSAASWTRSARWPRQEHPGLLHDRQRRLAGRLSRRRLHAVPWHQGHRARRRQPRSGLAWMPGKIAAGSKNHDILGGLDLMATFASVGGVKLPEQDRAGQPIIFDSYDMSPVLVRHRQVPAQGVVLLHRERADARCGARRQLQGRVQSPWRQRGTTGGLAVDTNLGWKGAEKYVATVPQVFDLWQDPQERYDIFMNNFTERTWTMVTISEHQEADEDLRAVSAAQAAERGLQRSDHPLELRAVPVDARKPLAKEGVSIPMPAGN